MADSLAEMRIGERNRARAARTAGDFAATRALFEESIAVNRRLGNDRRVVREQHDLGWMELRIGDVESARELFTTVRLCVVRDGYVDFIPCAALDAAAVAVADGAYLWAARLIGLTESALHQNGGKFLDPDDAVEHVSLRVLLMKNLGRSRFEVEYVRGSELLPLESLAVLPLGPFRDDVPIGGRGRGRSRLR